MQSSSAGCLERNSDFRRKGLQIDYDNKGCLYFAGLVIAALSFWTGPGFFIACLIVYLLANKRNGD